MAARYRSGYLVPGGVERSLTQRPWRPGNAFTWSRSTSHPHFDRLHHRLTAPANPSELADLWPARVMAAASRLSWVILIRANDAL
jgi:hypothetical protein